jgi:N-formylglutamate amidohydrolase
MSMISQMTLDYADGYRSSCKYHADGTMNFILSAPHGGSRMPVDVPDRTATTNKTSSTYAQHYKPMLLKDSRTDEFTENVANELYRRWNMKPFVIIGQWNRKKVDFNRNIAEGTCDQPEAMIAYENYHQHVRNAIRRVHAEFGHGLLIDIHGHSQGK